MRTHGWPYPFRAVPWETTAVFLRGMADRHGEFTHMARIAESVIATGTTTLLANYTSMHDLIVVPTPIADPPYDVIAVRALGSIKNTPTGQVIIEHLTCSGHNDVIQRPTKDAVPLFWRFVIEKYGIRPVNAVIHSPN
jgi:hypothetical protein